MTDAEKRFLEYQELRIKENMERYGDLIDTPHPTHEGHPKMPLKDRAAQFSSFAALTGLDDAMDDTAAVHEGNALHDTERAGFEEA